MLDWLAKLAGLGIVAFVLGLSAPLCRTLGGDGMAKLYPAYGHSTGTSSSPWFSIRDDKVYPTHGHPEGTSASPLAPDSE